MTNSEKRNPLTNPTTMENKTIKIGEIVRCIGKDLHAQNNIKHLRINGYYEVLATKKAGICEDWYYDVREIGTNHIVSGAPVIYFKLADLKDRFTLNEVPRAGVWFAATIAGNHYSILNIGALMKTAPIKYEGFIGWEALDSSGESTRADTLELLIDKLSDHDKQ